MPLDGLRAWIGEVERKLAMRTRVFLVLATIAIGGAGAAIYLALDTRDNAVSESGVQELQERLEARIGVAGAGADTTQLEAELNALEAKVERLDGNGGEQGREGAGAGAGDGIGTGLGATGDTGADAGGASAGTGQASSPRLQELLERGKEESREAEERDRDAEEKGRQAEGGQDQAQDDER
jgi:hypothetical protein